MPGPLKNARHERFAQELAKGKSQVDAYEAAGYQPDRGAAARLSANVSVQGRVAELQERAAEKAVVTQERVLKELARIGFSDMRKLLRWTGNLPKLDEDQAEETGEVNISVANLVQLFDSGELDDDIAACISEISQTREGALKVKLYDKQQALVSLARHLGMFKDGAPPINVNVGIGLGAFYGEDGG
jgi:phage terminase small subunit